jgi:hypothetical protein
MEALPGFRWMYDSGMESLHPAPVEDWPTDHREAENRDQLREPSDLQGVWKRAVEQLASDLQIEPIDAHFLLRDASDAVSKGLAWRLWD